eukprot:243630-Chlamydomonas_euryale.AAC.5
MPQRRASGASFCTRVQRSRETQTWPRRDTPAAAPQQLRLLEGEAMRSGHFSCALALPASRGTRPASAWLRARPAASLRCARCHRALNASAGVYGSASPCRAAKSSSSLRGCASQVKDARGLRRVAVTAVLTVWRRCCFGGRSCWRPH